MKEKRNYLFESERLGFRNWESDDITKMSEINADEKVMEFFPGIYTIEQTKNFIERMQKQYLEKGFCYFAVDKLKNQEFIGFIGLSVQTYESEFTPCIDIGWRISSKEWNKGFATEGAKRCLQYAVNELKIETVYSVAPKVNVKSERIMQKLGMIKLYEFEHSLLKNDDRLRTCVLYRN